MGKQTTEIRRIKKLFFLLMFIFITLIIFIFSISNTIIKDRKIPKLLSSHQDLAVRGNIYSSDNFKIATSKKLFKVSIDIRCLDKDKEELFIKLFSLYSDVEPKSIRAKIRKGRKENKSNLVLSYKINSRSAKNLNELKYKLRRLNVFKAIKINGTKITYGLNINESGEKRIYPYEDTLTPVIGYMKKFETKNGQTKVNGVKGLENKYNTILNNVSDGILKGERDVLSYIVFNKNSIIKIRKDGEDLHLNISLKLQRNVELILDKYKEKLGADEIIISIMESSSGKVLSLASSNRFNPSYIKKEDIPNLNVSAVEYQFEPGSVVKPLAISLVLDKNKVKLNELIFAHNKGKKNKKDEYPKGVYKIGRWSIHDDHQFKKHYLTVKDIVINSSNIGTLLLAQRLSGREFYDGLKSFGLAQKTGIDLPYEQKGLIHSVRQYQAGESKGKDNIFKATDSYGQGITTTFMQLIKAYSVFNNDGKFSIPQIVKLKNKAPQKQVIKKKTANIMKKLLIQTVQEGTGKKAQIDGLEIGGKTGTANVVQGGKYRRKYMSSFFGFANDKAGHKYTIGVTVNNPINRGKYWYYYYASNSAVPVFKELVSTLVKLNYLEPSLDIMANKINK
ncbi:MAG: penicillin-binding protein 2 [Arcobacteraceae bacterium]|nr:penicillin-binding protein 2 [Arcobacteraceae bacterium]